MKAVRIFTRPYRDPLSTDIPRQLKDQSDRGAAIIGASFVEHHLVRLLLARMRELSKKRIEYLFDGFGPLAGFASKIEVASALNLFGDDARLDLLAINSIRNKFAHRIEGDELTFEHTDIKAKCDELKLWKVFGSPIYPGGGVPDLKTSRGQFILSVYLLSSQLEGETIANEQKLFTPEFLTH